MATVDTFLPQYEFNRSRTLALLKLIEELPDPQAALGWRPGPGRAHIGWQLMHIAITEELFATERLAPEKKPRWPDLVPRFRGGSTPDDNVPNAGLILRTLGDSRARLLETLKDFPEQKMGEIVVSLGERKFTGLTVMQIIAWHEPHHQGQSHLTLNLYKNRQA